MKTFIQSGTRFGRLLVLSFNHSELKVHEDSKRNHNIYFYKCLCDCGKEIIVRENSLKTGNTKSCGCLNHDNLVKRNTTHSLSKTNLYKRFHDMKKRCYDPRCHSYKDYGQRGIKICDEWLNDFSNFYNWAISNGYQKGLTIERLDVNKNYCPDNCTWIPKGEQNKNTTKNRFYDYNGEKHLMSEWAKLYSLPFTCVRKRLMRGWSMEKTLTTPIKR